MGAPVLDGRRRHDCDVLSCVVCMPGVLRANRSEEAFVIDAFETRSNKVCGYSVVGIIIDVAELVLIQNVENSTKSNLA